MTGWIKLHRSILEWEWYMDNNVKLLWYHLLLTCNYKDSKYMGYDIPAGSKVYGYPVLSEQTGLTVQQIRTALDKLKSTNEITVRKTPKFSIISITNWNKFQDDNSEITVEQQSSNSRATTSKEGKKEKKIRNRKNLGKASDITQYMLSDEFKSITEPDEPFPIEWGNKAATILDDEDEHEIVIQWNKFVEYYQKKGIERTDWNRSWINWLHKAKSYKEERRFKHG